MFIRAAEMADIPAMHRIRLAVKENVLRNPLAVQEADYIPYLIEKVQGWVAEIEHKIVGFAIVDLQGHDVWALFVDPEKEGQGLGGALHDLMLEWYFAETDEPLHLGTEGGTRAEIFYRKRGWKEMGREPNGDLTFLMPRKPLHLLS